MTTGDKRYRLIQWGTGAVGGEIIKAVLDDPSSVELVGVKVYSDSKDGVDVGTLVQRAPAGIHATTDTNAILALDADCVIYAPRVTDLGDVCALLASGKNVVTPAFLFHPDRIEVADRNRLLAACREGRSTLHGSGLNPGNLSAVLPLALSGMSRTIDKITLQERGDWSVYESTAITFDLMGFGRPTDEIGPHSTEFLSFHDSLWTQQVWFLADTLNADIDGVSVSIDAVPAREDHHVFGYELRAGTTAGQRWRWVGHRNGEVVIEIETLWTVGNEYPPHWPTPREGWTLTIEGDPSMQAHIMLLGSFSRALTIQEHLRAVSIAPAMQVLNAVPSVCEADPGFATAASLPLIRSRNGFAQNAVGK